MMYLDKYFLLNLGSTGPLNIYLGGKVSEAVLTKVVEAYEFSLVNIFKKM